MATTEPQTKLEKIQYYFSVVGESKDWEQIDFARATRYFDFSRYETIEPDALPYGGVYRGWDGYMECSMRVWNYWGGIKVDVVDLTEGTDHVIALLHISATGKTGMSFSFPACEVFRFENGKVVEIKILWWDLHRARQCAGLP